ncbi:MAG: hypothetical protein R3A48_28955 [Polyangiales bacterium]
MPGDLIPEGTDLATPAPWELPMSNREPFILAEGGAEGTVLAKVGKVFKPVALSGPLSDVAGGHDQRRGDQRGDARITLSHTTSGAAAAGIGAGVLLRAESGAGTLRSAGGVDAIHTDVTDGAEVSALVLSAGIAGSLLEVARLATVASAVNGLSVTGSATGEPVQLGARGADTDITIALVPKGAGGAMLLAGSGDNAFGVTTGGIRVDSATDTGATPTVSRNSGVVRVQNGNTTVTVTNTLCTVDSKVFAQIRNTTTNAVSVLRVVPGAGSFDVVLSGDPGASHADLAFFMLQPDA